MKKRLFLILSVTFMLAAGCSNKGDILPDMVMEKIETAGGIEKTSTTGDEEISIAD